MNPPSLLATGFVVDAPHQGTTFPSAGGNSADPKVQAVYWRCMVALFASARITNPDQRLALFCNVTPPVVDGVDLAAVLAKYAVELHLVPLTARLPEGRAASWGNVLYFFDILTALESEPDDLRFALVDSDVLVTASLAPLWALLDRADFAGYVVETGADEPVNGMTRRSMAAAAEGLAGQPFAPLPHFGGELFATTIGAWKRHRQPFDTMLEQATRGAGPAAAVLTEEHIFSIAFALLDQPAANAQGVINRIWTSPRHNTAQPGDQHLPIWHLPAEKRYGLKDVYDWLAKRGFPTALPFKPFHQTMMQLCAVPRKSAGKWLRDGLRQVAAKLGGAAMTRSSGRRIALGVGANVIDRITMVLIQLLLIPVLATHWGLERFGGWAMLITVPALLALSDLGFASAATARMTMEAARGERSAARTTMRSATQVVFLACAIIFTVVTLTTWVLPESMMYTVHGTSNLETRWAITLLSFYACLVMISALFMGLLRSNQRFSFGAILSTATSVLENGFLVIVVVGGHGIGAGAGALVAGRCLGLLTTFVTAKKLRTGMLPGLTEGSSKVRQELLGPSLAAMAIPVASALLLQGTVVALGLTAGAALVPAFVAARTLSRFSLQGAQVFTTPLMPEFAAAEAHGDRRQVMRLVLLVFGSGTLIALPYAAVLALAGPWIIEIWSHQAIHASSSLMVVIAVSSIFGGIWNPLSNLILAINRQSEFALAYAIFSAMAVVLTLALGAHFGNMAAALALAFVDIAMLIVVARFAFKNWLEPGSAKLAWQDIRSLVGRWVG